MRAVILAGGFGTRISEESHLKPKPMIEIGGRPILWHIMKIYAAHGITEFVICCGYKGYLIKEYFANYFLHTSDMTIDLQKNEMHVHHRTSEPWKVTMVDTGQSTMTGGRLKRVQEHLDGTFCMTYGDGVSDINISELIAFHKDQGRAATVTCVQPAGRFGAVEFEGGQVTRFLEKPEGDGRWISGGFFVLEPEVFEFLGDDDTIWEREPVENLAQQNKLSGYKHHGFWAAMDTLRDRVTLEEQWASGDAPWKVWS